jgi:hypothetical protein
MSLLKAVPVSRERSRLLELVFGLEPILKLTTPQAAAFQINFVSASPDLAVIYFAVRRGIFCTRLNGACVKLQSLTFLAFRCHTSPFLSWVIVLYFGVYIVTSPRHGSRRGVVGARGLH